MVAGKVPVVDEEKCIGCGVCAALCPNAFSMNVEGKSEVSNPEGASESEIQGAIDACPVQAISWKKK